MSAQLVALGLEHEYFRGIDAARGDLQGLSRYDERKAIRWLGHALQPSEVGCFASHFRVWELCVKRNEPLVVMEDDVVLEPGFAQAVKLASEHIQRRRFIRLCGLAKRTEKLIEPLTDGYRLVRYLKGPRGTQCYAISPDGARALLRGAQVWIDAVDLYIDGFWLHGLASYAITPYHVLHEAEGAPSSLIGQVRWAARRSLGSKLRRETTHFFYRLRRGWFNFRQNGRDHAAPAFGGITQVSDSAAGPSSLRRDSNAR